MSDISTDRSGNLAFWPAFLPERTSEETSVWRLFLFIAVAIPALLISSLAAVVVSHAIGSGFLTAAGAPLGYVAAREATMSAITGSPDGLSGEILLVVLLGTMFTLWSVAILTPLRFIYRRPARTWITAAPRFRWRAFGLGLLGYGVILGTLLSLVAVFDPQALEAPVFDGSETIRMRIAYVAALLIFLPLAAGFEEILCRGWMLQQTAAWTRNIVPILFVNAAIFSAMHVDPDVGRNLSRLASGLVFSWGALRLGGLEFSMGAHTINNVLLALFATTLSKGTDPTEVSRSIDVIGDLGANAALVVVIELIARSPSFRRWAQLDVALPSAGSPAAARPGRPAPR